jgi:hypothetical protein
MKTLKFSLLTLFLLFSFVSLHAHENSCSCLSSRDYDCFKSQKGDNIYINEEYLVIDEGKIFLDMGGNLVQVHSILSDSQGLYLSEKSESKQGWTCPVCGHRNPPSAFICEKVRYHYDFD